MSSPIIIYGGGTINKVRPHLAISAPAYGTTARYLATYFRDRGVVTSLRLTKMADAFSSIETNDDLHRDLAALSIGGPVRAIIMSAAVADFHLDVPDAPPHERLRSNKHYLAELEPAQKLLGGIRKHRKDIFLVAFKTTTNATRVEQFNAALSLMKRSSCNLVLANDLVTRNNMIVTPEEAQYGDGHPRPSVLDLLGEMTLARSELRFTRSTVKAGDPVPWSDAPTALRAVVDHCIAKGAYKPFEGKTVGHFAYRGATDVEVITSRRKSNFNDLATTGMVRIEARGEDEVLAYGGKPSVGGQSQRIIFKEHPDYDHIVHFHVPPRRGVQVPTAAQWRYECGSHECGASTSRNLVEVAPGIKAVYLKNHGPNVVYRKDVDPANVIAWIDDHFDLRESTRPGAGL